MLGTTMKPIGTLLLLSLSVVHCVQAGAVPTTTTFAHTPLTGINGNHGQPMQHTPLARQLFQQQPPFAPAPQAPNVRNDFAQDILINPEDIQFETPGVPQQVGAQIVSQIRAQLGNKPILLSELNKRNINISAELPGVHINRTVVTKVEESFLNKTSRMTNNGGSYVTTSYLPPTQVKDYYEVSNKQQSPPYYGQQYVTPPPPSYGPSQYKPNEQTGYGQDYAKEQNYAYKAPEVAPAYATPEPTQSYKKPEPTPPAAYPASTMANYASAQYVPPPPSSQYSKPAAAYSSPPQEPKVVVKYIEVCNQPAVQFALPKLPNLDKYSDQIAGVPDLKKSLYTEYQQLNDIFAQVQKSLGELQQLQEHLGNLKEAQNAYQEAVSQLSRPYNEAKSAYDQLATPYQEAKSAYDQMSTPYQEAKSAYESVTKPYQEANSVYGQAADAYQEAKSLYEQAQKAHAAKSYASDYVSPSPSPPPPPPPSTNQVYHQPNAYRKEYATPASYQPPTYNTNNGQGYVPPKAVENNNSYDGNKIKVSYHKTEESLKTNSTAPNYYN